MADIRRPRYFRYQFLLENDFNEEQAYHVQMRKLQNHYLRSPGVVSGLEVEKVGPKEVRVRPGMAIDENGQEIVVPPESPPLSVPLSSFDPNDEVYIAIQYMEEDDQLSEAEIGGSTVYTRVFEKAAAVADTTNPDTDPTRVTLGKVVLDGSGDIIDPIVFGDREESTADIAAGAVNTDQLAANAVTSAKLDEADGSSGQNTNSGSGVKAGHIQNSAVTEAKLSINAVTSAKLDEADGSSGQNTNSGSGVKSGHIQNDAVTQAKLAANAVNGSKIANNAVIDSKIANNAVIGSKIANNTIGEDKLDPATRGKLVTNGNSHDHDGSDSVRISPTNLAGVGSNLTASNLNILVGGASSNASNLHYHQTIPTQTIRYHLPLMPHRNGSSPEFSTAPAAMNAASGVRAVGKIPLYFPDGVRLVRIGISTSTSLSTFSLTMDLWQVFYGSNSGSILSRTTVTSSGNKETALNHVVNLTNGNYLVLVNINTPGSSSINIYGIFLDYELSRLY